MKKSTEKPVEEKPVKAEKPVEEKPVTGLTVKGVSETEGDIDKIYNPPLKNGKENSFFTFDGDYRYIIPVNFDSFDFIIKENLEKVKGAEITATYKLRENGKTISISEIVYGGENGEKFPSLRQFYDRKGTGGIDTAEIVYFDENAEIDGEKGNYIKILYVNRGSKFHQFRRTDNLLVISNKKVG